MIPTLLKKIFGSRNDRLIKRYMHAVRAINALEPQIEALSDAQLRAKTDEFKQRLAKGETLDDVLPEAFAVVREAGKRTLNMRHFDVQLIGGMVLHYGKIAEMRTGEGKTLVATLPAYLNALTGTGVHVVTVNDYLASRDAAWMGNIYGFLGLDGRRQPVADGPRREASRLCRRHHLRHQQRVRFRLPARQHGLPDRGPRAAQAGVRDRRRSRLHPDRRSAHAAHHLRAGRRHHRPVLQDQRPGAQAHAAEGGERAGRLQRGRKSAPGAADRNRPRACRRHADPGRAAARRQQPVRRGQHHADASRVRSAARPQPVSPRPALRCAERRDRHRGRVHRTADARAPLVRRAASSGRSQGGREDSA